MIVVTGSVAWAPIPDSRGVINGCYRTEGSLGLDQGALRIIDPAKDQCRPDETASLEWLSAGASFCEVSSYAFSLLAPGHEN